MIDFDEIGLHDLLELEADGRHIEVAGWYHVEWVSSGWGEHHLEVEILGTHKQPHSLRKGDVAQIRRHIRAGGIPKAIEALENINEYWNRDQNEGAMADALWQIIEASDAALHAVRGESR